MSSTRPDWIKPLSVAVAVSLLGACATAPPAPPPPPPPPPPPVQAEVIPYRPVPPGGASYVMELPPLGADGRRATINSNLDENDTLWHLRSAWNVAALNCLDAGEEPILEGYRTFLTKYARPLSATNTAIDARWRRQEGSRNDGIKAREAFMTQVYNYFALPPARTEFCRASLAIANEFLLAQPEDPKAFAAAALPRIEAVFQEFFRQYQQYQVASADWDARYGARYGASQPGYVAVHSILMPTVGTSLVNLNAPAPAGEVVDPETGARIPIIAVPDGTVATPIVQPVPDEPGE